MRNPKQKPLDLGVPVVRDGRVDWTGGTPDLDPLCKALFGRTESEFLKMFEVPPGPKLDKS